MECLLKRRSTVARSGRESKHLAKSEIRLGPERDVFGGGRAGHRLARQYFGFANPAATAKEHCPGCAPAHLGGDVLVGTKRFALNGKSLSFLILAPPVEDLREIG